MALEFQPNQLVVDRIYHEIIGHANGERIYGRRNLTYQRVMGTNLWFTSFSADGRIISVQIPYTTQSTFSLRNNATDEQPPYRVGTPDPDYESSDDEEEEDDDEYGPYGMDAPAAAAAGRDLMRKSKSKSKRKGKSKKRRSRKMKRRKTRKMRRRRFVF